jgi:hypothetical protein
MKEIIEDYVSFEVAKLLKENGFKGSSIITEYDNDAASAYIKELKEKHLPYSSDDPKFKEFYYTKPTLQMACKWLREVHKLFIHVSICNKSLYDDGSLCYLWYINAIEPGVKHLTDIAYAKTCEQATEDGIKYCLEHLI